MTRHRFGKGLWRTVGVVALACLSGLAAPAPAGEVTLVGNVLSNVHTGEKDKSLFVLAYDGTPEIKAEFDRIIDDFYPASGLDADAAVKLQDQFMVRTRYFIVGPLADDLYKRTQWTIRGPMALTGTIEEKDGGKWITVSKCEKTSFNFPDKMMAPDKPATIPDKPPLILKVDDGLTLKCLYVPAGKFLMGEPYYQIPHWQEDPPHLVTLTRPYYLAECPITQEIYQAVMGSNPSKFKGPRLPVHMISCVDMYAFCAALSKRTGHMVHVPTEAQWEYAARVGTSNPTFPSRYAEQNSNADSSYDSAPLAVKSAKPNAWGFYDMHSGWWERVADSPNVRDRSDAIDPEHIPAQDKDPAARGTKHSHVGKGQYTYAISEIEYISSEAGQVRFRVAVEAGE